jgi:bifunctional non-homologous end joining protein LigD
VCAYSLRAQPMPAVSTPVTWEELETAARKSDGTMLYFEAEDVIRRVHEGGDLFKPVVESKQELPAAARLQL